MYNLPLVNFDGCLNGDYLREALQYLVDRHASLRTNFRVIHGSPAQVIARHRTIELPVTDLNGIAEPDRDAHIFSFIVQRAAHVRLAQRSALSAAFAETFRTAACAASEHASYRLRWLVRRNSARFTLCTLPLAVQPRDSAFARPADSVSGLCPLATSVVAGRSAGEASGLLETPSRCAPPMLRADRSAATDRAALSWRLCPGDSFCGVVPRLAQTEPPARCNALHDAAGRLCADAPPVQWPNGHRHRLADRRQDSHRGRAIGGISRQHAGSAN